MRKPLIAVVLLLGSVGLGASVFHGQRADAAAGRQSALAATPNRQSAPRAIPHTNDFNVVWSQTDMNGIPFRPKWFWQLSHAGVPDPAQKCFYIVLASNPISCTTQHVGTDDATSCTLPFAGQKTNGISGHVNWQAATYDGELFWDSKSASYEDDDYNFTLRYFNNDVSGLTPPNLEPSGGGHSGLEFDSDETVDQWGKDINDRTYFWPRFRAAVDSSDSLTKSLVDGRYAIVTGLLGLDMSHSGGSELHPVYAMAIRIDSGRGFEDWAMFVRDWGDEGWCSSHQWFLNLAGNRYTFALPWQSTGLPTPTIPVPTAHFLTTDTSGQAEGPDLTYVPGQKVLVSFTLPRINPVFFPELQNYPAIWGVLHLDWKKASVVVPPQLKNADVPETTPESVIGNAVGKLPAAKMQQLLAGLPPVKQTKSRLLQPRSKPTTVASLKAVRVPAKPPAVTSQADSAKVKLDARRRQLICQAFTGTRLPRPAICR